MLKKTILSSIVALSFGCLPVLAQAGDLNLRNETKNDSTCIINKGMCSADILHEGGITRAGGKSTVVEALVNRACAANRSNCTADVYMTDNCSGPKIATVVLDTKEGVKSVQMIDNNYKITYNHFDVVLQMN